MYKEVINRLFQYSAILLLCLCTSLYAQSGRSLQNGQTRLHDNGFVVWDGQVKKWVKPGRFWANYAQRKGSRNWGRAKFYPPRAKTRAHDVITIVTPGGSCLMEFYHNRWRRANDVWRWSKRFSGYAGCATVHRYRRNLFSRRQRH